MVIRNVQRRRTLFWPVTGGRVMPIAAGERFTVADVELDALPGLRGALAALVRGHVVVVEAEGVRPLLH